MKDYYFLQKKYLLNTYPNRGITFVKGKGVYLIDNQGKKYLDLGSNYGVNIAGYNHPFFTVRLLAQFKRLINLHGSFISDVRSEAAFRLIKRVGLLMDKVFFVNSGSEAIEVALKLGLLFSKKKKILSFENAFHGKTLGALSATYNPKYKKGLPESLFSFVTYAKFNDLKSLREKFTKEIGVVIFEPIQGDGGIREAKYEFVKEIFSLASKNKAIVIVDEVQTGCGRTGRFLAIERYNVFPDIITLGKGIAGGLPVGIVLIKKGLSDKVPKLFQTSTFGGNPFTSAGVLSTLQWLNGQILEDVKEKGKEFKNLLEKIKSPLIKQVRGRGLMIGVELRGERDLVLKKLQENKIVALPASEKVVRFLPPYIISSSQLKKAAEKFAKVIKSLEKNNV